MEVTNTDTRSNSRQPQVLHIPAKPFLINQKNSFPYPWLPSWSSNLGLFRFERDLLFSALHLSADGTGLSSPYQATSAPIKNPQLLIG